MSSLSSRLSRRKPWLAAVLNVVWPGVGHLYAGRGRLALVLLLLAPVAGTVISLLPFIIPVPVANILVPAVLAVALLALFAWDAARAAAKRA